MQAIDYGSRGRIGILLPSGNQAAEAQLRRMLPEAFAICTTRLKLADSKEASLLGMADGVEQAAELLADAQVDLILFHCTAVSTFSLELEASIVARIAAAAGRPVATTSQALVAALQAVGAQRLVMLSPYIEAINRREAAFLQAHGFEVLASAGRNCHSANEMMAVTPQAWMEMGLAHRDERAQAYLLSCTTVRSAEAVQALEKQLDRPVITSNTAVAWHCMRRLGAADRVEGFGRLLSTH